MVGLVSKPLGSPLLNGGWSTVGASEETTRIEMKTLV